MLTVMTLLLSAGTVNAYAQTTNQSYVITAEGKKLGIVSTYVVSKTYSYFNLDIDTLVAPTDIYIDTGDNLYILDAGNSRVLKLLPDGTLDKEIKFAGDDKLNNPNGIYVNADGDIYIADTDNGRVLVTDENGLRKNILVQPDSELYDKDYPFRPMKVEVDDLGQIYVINRLDYHGFTILDENNEFKGYLGATRLAPNVLDNIIYLFASESQKEKLGRRTPPIHTNFTISTDGSIYTTTGNTDTAQFKKFSAVGNNFYPKQDSFGDSSSDYIMQEFGKEKTDPNFVDVCVDEQGIVTLLDNASGRIYQYDSEGIMLDAFAGTGNWAGRFINAVALDNDSRGNLYVLDENLCTVQVFSPTKFIKTIQEALGLYGNGKYIEAMDLWEKILKIDSAYPVAHIGMGKAELKQGDYQKSMDDYRQAGDKYGYSAAFKGYRKIIVQKYFLLIAIGSFAAVIALLQIISKAYHKARKIGNGR